MEPLPDRINQAIPGRSLPRWTGGAVHNGVLQKGGVAEVGKNEKSLEKEGRSTRFPLPRKL